VANSPKKIADSVFWKNERGAKVQVLNRCRPSSSKSRRVFENLKMKMAWEN